MKVCFISSQGGHLAEAKLIADGLNGGGRGKKYEVFFVTDGEKAVEFGEKVYLVRHFVRNPFLVFVTAWQVFRILMKERPRAIICTGAEIALPSFLVNMLFFRLPTVYVECSAQVFSPSLTGRIIYHVAGLFLVQWEPLLGRYGPKAKYRGGFI